MEEEYKHRGKKQTNPKVKGGGNCVTKAAKMKKKSVKENDKDRETGDDLGVK